jgi:hypothetical protein
VAVLATIGEPPEGDATTLYQPADKAAAVAAASLGQPAEDDTETLNQPAVEATTPVATVDLPDKDDVGTFDRPVDKAISASKQGGSISHN